MNYAEAIKKIHTDPGRSPGEIEIIAGNLLDAVGAGAPAQGVTCLICGAEAALGICDDRVECDDRVKDWRPTRLMAPKGSARDI